jgi:hypothetical protein
VTAREQARHELFDNVVLTDDDLGNLLPHSAIVVGQCRNRGYFITRRLRTSCHWNDPHIAPIYGISN